MDKLHPNIFVCTVCGNSFREPQTECPVCKNTEVPEFEVTKLERLYEPGTGATAKDRADNTRYTLELKAVSVKTLKELNGENAARVRKKFPMREPPVVDVIRMRKESRSEDVIHETLKAEGYSKYLIDAAKKNVDDMMGRPSVERCMFFGPIDKVCRIGYPDNCPVRKECQAKFGFQPHEDDGTRREVVDMLTRAETKEDEGKKV